MSPAREAPDEGVSASAPHTARAVSAVHTPPRGVTCGWEDGAGRGPEARALLQMHGVCWSLAQRSWGRRASGPLVLEEEGEVLCFLPWRFEVVPGLTNMSVGY